MSTLTVDRVYSNLLTHLQHPRPSISVETVVNTVPHYLARLPLPNPTQLTAYVISSPLWRPVSLSNSRSLMTAYRTAFHLKRNIIQEEAGGWLGRSPQALLAEWASAVMKGVSRGDPQLRVIILGGILQGLNDFIQDDVKVWTRDRLERQVIIACAEVMEELPAATDIWENEFNSNTRPDNNTSDCTFLSILPISMSQSCAVKETIFLYSAYTILPLVDDSKFLALDIDNTFSSGNFLSGLSQSAVRGSGGLITIPQESPLVNSLKTLDQNILYKDAGSLAKLLARCLSAMPDRSPTAVRSAFQDVALRMEAVTSKVGRDWNASALSDITSGDGIEIDSRQISTDIWRALKTLLFTHLLISLSILSSLVYLRPLKAGSEQPSSSTIAESILRSLYNQSFILSQFGGIVSSADTFKELKRVFYTALDIIAADSDSQACESLVNELVSHVQADIDIVTDSELTPTHPSRQAQTAFVLAVIEQLMNLLSDHTIKDTVVRFCTPYLSDPSHRETFESAHSVMLSIFAAHSSHNGTSTGTDQPNLAARLVPFYVDCLIENADDGRLNVSQLRLAYSSLVRSASTHQDDTLVWLCVSALLAHIHASSSARMPLHLTLVSMISSVPRSLLPRVLEEVQKILDKAEDHQKAELKKAIVDEIMHKVGDLEKQTVLQWWIGLGAEPIDGSCAENIT
ncbi:hypothetical protein BU17DRAFT_46263 [Hysterangium stoloniferum]|nr:hypothetical protein BU17DRAFT_46263 [Hysterangium stoloniferum]